MMNQNELNLSLANDDPRSHLGLDMQSAYQTVARAQYTLSALHDVAPRINLPSPVELWFRVQTVPTGYSRPMDTTIQLVSSVTMTRTSANYRLYRMANDNDSGWWKTSQLIQDPGECRLIGDAWDAESEPHAWNDFWWQCTVRVWEYGLYYETSWRVHPQLTHNAPHPTVSKKVFVAFRSATPYNAPPGYAKLEQDEKSEP